MRLYRLLVAILMAACLPCMLFGQEQVEEAETDLQGKSVEFTIDPIVPVYTFRESLEKDIVGLSTAFYWEHLKSQAYDFWGIQVNYAHIGAVSNSYLFPTGIGSVEVDERTGSSFWGVHALYRYYPSFYFWRIEPFAELAFGTNMFFTSTTRNFYDADGSSDFDINEFDMGVSYGLATGFSCHIYGQVFFVFKCALYGGNAVTYMVNREPASVVPINDFQKKTSQTSYLRFQLGASVNFL